MLDLAPSMFISHIVVLLVAFPIHEFAHAWTANFFGDDTPRLAGRLTLNPLVHLDVLGSILLVVAGFGWAKPVPINPYVLSLRSSAAYMLVSLAGPASNFFMAVLAAVPFQLGLVTAADAQLSMITANDHFLPSVAQVLLVFIYINLLLMLFNLIPLSPLDGEKIARYFLPESWRSFMDQIRPFSPIILLALVFLGLISNILSPVLSWMMGIFIG
jgi:Zn-dependent protease